MLLIKTSTCISQKKKKKDFYDTASFLSSKLCATPIFTDCKINEFWGFKVHKSQLQLRCLNISTWRMGMGEAPPLMKLEMWNSAAHFTWHSSKLRLTAKAPFPQTISLPPEQSKSNSLAIITRHPWKRRIIWASIGRLNSCLTPSAERCCNNSALFPRSAAKIVCSGYQ